MSALPAYEVEQGFRLSPSQQRLWRAGQTWPGLALGAQLRVRLRGALEPARLDAAVAGVRARHEILRTRFAHLSGTRIPVQLAEPAGAGLDEQSAGPQTDPQRIAQAHWERLCDFATAPAWTFALVRLAQHEHVLLVTASGLCGDGLGAVNVVREIAAEYAGCGTDDGDVLQYADLAEWQNGILGEPAADAHAPYWSAAEYAQLGFPRLPFTLLRPAGAAPRVESLVVDLPAAPSPDAPEHFARLLSAWSIVLQRLSRGERFLIGVSLDGRLEPELQAAAGPLARTLPLALSVPAAAAFPALVAQVSDALEAAHHDHYLFGGEAAARLESPERRHAFPMLFAVRAPAPLGSAGGLEWELDALVERLEPCDLSATVVHGRAGTQLELAWDASLYARADVELTARHYRALLGELQVDAARSLGTLRLGDGDAGSDDASEPDEASVFRPLREQIEDHARRAPASPAIVCGDDTLSYGELDRRAASLARRLRLAGAEREAVVALVAERSVEFFVGLLAVLKTGAAWLPLEPETPPERLRDMLAQSGARLVALGTDVAPPDGVTQGLTTLALGTQDQATDAPVETRPTPTHPRELAYIIFTSGSTGRPKGVALEQGHIAAYLRGLARRVDLSPHRSFALVSTVAADLGHTVVFAALTTGGCLHVIPARLASDADALAGYFQARPVDFIKIVPAHLQALCASFPETARLPWRCVVTGGERLTWDVVAALRRVAPDARVFNHYGPTETTVGALCTPVERAGDPYDSSGVALGRALAGAAARVLDDALRPVPAWCPGELYIGGAGVGRGYVGRPDLTAERFIPDPFSARPGARMYRTGDLVLRRGDGALEFLGRRDGQIKLRGYRVELGEIEATLSRHPDVHKAAVAALGGDQDSVQLVAWVAVGQARLRADELRGFLATRLPQFMIPGTIVCVERLKLTSNGKIDRHALPEPPAVAAGGGAGEPLDEIEAELLSVWRQVLGREQVGVDDNYFALGGDSLRVIQLVHEARRRGLSLLAADVLRHPSVRRLRRAMQERHRHVLFPDGVPALATPPREAPPHLPEDVEDAYPISGIQRFMLDAYARGRAGRGVYHIQECLHLRDAGFSLEALEQAFRAVVRRHPALRTVFDLNSEPPLQWVRRNPRWTLAVEDLRGTSAEAQEAHIEAALRDDRLRPFDPGERDTPLFRARAFLRSPDECSFALSCHHAILDGWGHRVMTNQLFEAYAAVKAGRAPELGQPDSTYREFVTFQEAVRATPAAAAYWRRYLDGFEPARLTPAPGAGPEPDEPLVMSALGSELTEHLRALGRRHMVSLQAVFLGAWLTALREWSGEDGVAAGALVNGRSESFSDPLAAVGLFWNIVPVVSRHAAPLAEVAAAVQRDLIESEPYAAYPWPQIQADQDGRELFFSSFRYLHFWNEEQPPRASSLRLESVSAYDRYSFPLDCAAFLRAAGRDGYLALQYDPAVVTEARARDALALFERVLRAAADMEPRAPD